MLLGSHDGAPLVVFGTGGHAKSVADAAIEQGLAIRAFVGQEGSPAKFLDTQVVQELAPSLMSDDFLITVAIGDNYLRESVTADALARYPRAQLATIVHPSAAVSKLAHVEGGATILQGAVVGASARVGPGALVNSSAVVDHDCNLGQFVSVGPGAVLGGGVRVGRRSAIGIGATVKHGVPVGEDVIVGAASYVHTEIPACVVAYGVPAIVIRSHVPGAKYLE